MFRCGVLTVCRHKRQRRVCATARDSTRRTPPPRPPLLRPPPQPQLLVLLPLVLLVRRLNLRPHGVALAFIAPLEISSDCVLCALSVHHHCWLAQYAVACGVPHLLSTFGKQQRQHALRGGAARAMPVGVHSPWCGASHPELRSSRPRGDSRRQQVGTDRPHLRSARNAADCGTSCSGQPWGRRPPGRRGHPHLRCCRRIPRAPLLLRAIGPLLVPAMPPGPCRLILCGDSIVQAGIRLERVTLWRGAQHHAFRWSV